MVTSIANFLLDKLVGRNIKWILAETIAVAIIDRSISTHVVDVVQASKVDLDSTAVT